MRINFDIRYKAINRDFLKYLEYQATHNPGTENTDFIRGWEMASAEIQRKFEIMLEDKAYRMAESHKLVDNLENVE